MKIGLYGNGGSGNHGCEAIIRGTIELLGEENQYFLNSIAVGEDKKYGLNEIVNVKNALNPIKKNLQFYNAYIKMKLFKRYVEIDGLEYLKGINELSSETDIVLSVGGDNYCYDGTEIYPYLNKKFKKRGKKRILWGCSVEPAKVKDKYIAKDLASYDSIVTRESITYEAIKNINDSSFLVPDPAFYMTKKEICINELFWENDVIGINISPMIISNESNKGITLKNYINTTSYILDNSECNVALIPHVVWKSNDDREALKLLKREFNDNDRVVVFDDHNAMELKYIISKCDFFIGARTHATIAAYSTYVPTLVMGYSVKARGIARDIFGTEEGYVLPVQSLKNEDDLTKCFVSLYEKKDEIRKHLETFIPEYTRKGRETLRNIGILQQ